MDKDQQIKELTNQVEEFLLLVSCLVSENAALKEQLARYQHPKNSHNSSVPPDLHRLKNLFLLTMTAFVWCYKVGDFLDRKIRKIKIKTHGRRAVSLFKYGPDNISNELPSGFKRMKINIFEFLSCI